MRKLPDLGKIDYELVSKASAVVMAAKEKMTEESYRGHHYSKHTQKDFGNLLFGMYHMSSEMLSQIASGSVVGKIPINRRSSLLSCYYCGEDICFLYDGEKVEADTACKYPGGIQSMDMELNCPSGKLVFANDLRRWFRVIGDWDINKQIGKLQTFKAYENVGMAHGFVGNSCPGVYRIDSKNLTISSSAPESYYDGEAQEYVDYTEEEMATMEPPGENVGGICTDLWWYCIVDYDDLIYRLTQSGMNDIDAFLKHKCDIVDVEPGVYRVEHHLENNRYDDSFHLKEQVEPWHYAKITWVKNPAPIRNFLAEYKSLNYTIGQAWLESLSRFPSLYGFEEEELPESLTMEERVLKLSQFPIGRIEESAARFYDHTFCANGTGIDWHPNGWGSSGFIDPETPDFILPPLTKAYHWYPMSSNYCSLDLAALDKEKWGERVHFNESFLRSAWEVIHSILKYGVVVSAYRGASEEREKQILVDAALSHLRGLNTRYPGTMPPEYQEYLSQYLSSDYDADVARFRKDEYYASTSDKEEDES